MVLSDPEAYPPERLVTFSRQLGDLLLTDPSPRTR